MHVRKPLLLILAIAGLLAYTCTLLSEVDSQPPSELLVAEDIIEWATEEACEDSPHLKSSLLPSGLYHKYRKIYEGVSMKPLRLKRNRVERLYRRFLL